MFFSGIIIFLKYKRIITIEMYQVLTVVVFIFLGILGTGVLSHVSVLLFFDVVSSQVEPVIAFDCYKVLLPVVVTAAAAIAVYYNTLKNRKSAELQAAENRKSVKLQAMHAESGWRPTLLAVLDHVDWGPNDLEKIRNRINVKWSSNEKLLSKDMHDFYIKGLMRDELYLLSKKEKITYSESFKLRQLVRMLLDNDFKCQSGKEMEFKDKESVDKYLTQYENSKNKRSVDRNFVK